MTKYSILVLLIAFNAYADNPHRTTSNITNTTEVINKFTNDECQGVAIGAAGANNQMYLGTHKPQLSLGVGECNGEVAGSLMFGMKPCKGCPLINGSIAVDDDVDAYGAGMTWIFK